MYMQLKSLPTVVAAMLMNRTVSTLPLGKCARKMEAPPIDKIAGVHRQCRVRRASGLCRKRIAGACAMVVRSVNTWTDAK